MTRQALHSAGGKHKHRIVEWVDVPSALPNTLLCLLKKPSCETTTRTIHTKDFRRPNHPPSQVLPAASHASKL